MTLTQRDKRNVKICSGILLVLGVLFFIPLVILFESFWGGVVSVTYIATGILGFYAAHKQEIAELVVSQVFLVCIAILNSGVIIYILYLNILIATYEPWICNSSDSCGLAMGLWVFLLIVSGIALVISAGILALAIFSLNFVRKLKKDIDYE